MPARRILVSYPDGFLEEVDYELYRSDQLFR
jgi:hypothetical protein